MLSQHSNVGLDPLPQLPPSSPKFSRKQQSSGMPAMQHSAMCLQTPAGNMQWFTISTKDTPYLHDTDECRVKFAYDQAGNTYVIKIIIVDISTLRAERISYRYDCFQDEANILNRLQLLVASGHRVVNNILKMYLVQQYIQGETLEDYLKDTPIDLPTQKDIFIKILRAIVLLQNNQISQGDIHRGNIIIQKDAANNICIKIIDYGEALIVSNPLNQSILLKKYTIDFQNAGLLLQNYFNTQELYNNALLPLNLHTSLLTLSPKDPVAKLAAIFAPLGISIY